MAVGHAPSVPGQVDANVESARALLALARESGARLLVLPELFLCGYDLDGLARAPEEYTVDLDGPELGAVAAACRGSGTGVVVGAALRRRHGLTNSAVVFDTYGGRVAVYDKAHLWEAERKVFVAGSALVRIEVSGVVVGLGICYDEGFPEFVRAYATAEPPVDAVVFPAAFCAGDQERRYDLYHPARALENGCYVLAANAYGEVGDLSFFGRSAAYDPRARLGAEVIGARGIATIDVDHAEVLSAREDLAYLRDRRTDLRHDERPARFPP